MRFGLRSLPRWKNGQSVKSIRQWLEEDAGIVVGITSLTSYISRIRRRESAIQRGQKSLPPPRIWSLTSGVVMRYGTSTSVLFACTAAGVERIAQAMRALNKPRLDIRKLHSDGDPTGKSLI